MKHAFGCLQPLSYAPTGVDNVMDFLVTTQICAQTQICFRFYPANAGYNSPASSTVSFYVTAPLTPSSFLRLIRVAPNKMQLLKRSNGSATWDAVSGTSIAAYIPYIASCFIFLSSKTKTIQPVAAIGFIAPKGTSAILPPVCVLPAQYSVLVPGFEQGAETFAYFNGPYDIPQNWHEAWETIRPFTNWRIATTGQVYSTTVDALENLLYVRLIPGQLTAVAFRYVPNNTVWACVATSAIPAATTVYLQPTTPLLLADPHYTWFTGATDICQGTVIVFSGLGYGGVVAVNIGSITLSGVLPNEEFYGITAFGLSNSADPVAIAATYTAEYYDTIPGNLTPGVTIRKCLWPAENSILSDLPCFSGPCNPTLLQLELNNSPLQAWICQIVPDRINIITKGVCRKDGKHSKKSSNCPCDQDGFTLA
jgi:hypothetical protein